MAAAVQGLEGDKLARLIALSMKDLIAAAATKRPVIIIFEDAHWADTSSIDLYISCLRLVIENPVLFINVFRPVSESSAERLLEFTEENLKDYSKELRLKVLGAVESSRLVENLLQVKDLPGGLKSQIIERTGGNPFFMEEVVRSLVDSGKIEIVEGACRPLDELEAISIPGTVEEVIMTRVDNLDGDKKELIKIAAVIGRYFFHKVLNRVAAEIENLDIHLEHLKGIQMIRERRRMDELEYLFKHALAQQAVYDSILKRSRKILHVSVAQAIEILFRHKLNEFYGMLAYHYSIGEDIDHAEEYLRKAGEQALKSSASAEALHYFTSALNLYRKKLGDNADPKKIAELERSIAHAYSHKGYHAEATKHYRIALKELDIMLKMPGKLSFLILIMQSIQKMKRFIKMQHPIKGKNLTDREIEIVQLAFEAGLSNGMVAGLANLDVTHFAFNAWIDAMELDYHENPLVPLALFVFIMASVFNSFGADLGRGIISIVHHYFDPENKILRFQYEFSHIAFCLGSGDTPRPYDKELVAFNLQYGNFQSVNCYLLWHGLLQIEKGDFTKMEEIVKFSNSICTDYENDEARLHSAILNGRFFLKTNKTIEALKELETAVNTGDLIGLRILTAMALGFKLQAESQLKELGMAEQTMHKIFEVQTQDPFLIAFANSAISIGMLSYYIAQVKNYKAERKAVPSAELKDIRKTLKYAEKNVNKWAADQTEKSKLIGSLYYHRGNDKQAKIWWERAIETGTKLGAKLEVEKTRAEMGRLTAEV